MCTTELDANRSWVPQVCTLPTAEQPLRVAEFDQLFRAARAVEQPEPRWVSLELDANREAAAMAADLVVRETACCSFFTFTLIATGSSLRLDVTVPPGQLGVLDALAARAREVAA